MLKTFFTNLFRPKPDITMGICREVPKEKMHFIYFTKENKEKIEEFLGDGYDFDFTESGIIVWDEETFKKVGLIRSFYFPYNMYILKAGMDFSIISKKTFLEKYEVTRW